MATNGNGDDVPPAGGGDLPVLDLRAMEELCQPTLNGRGRPIAPIAIQATNFGLKNDMIQQVQNSCQFHGLSVDDANKHLNKFLHVTQSIKVNWVTDDALPWERYKLSIDRCPNHNMLPVTQIYTFYNGLTLRHRDTINVVAGGTFMKRSLEECYDLIENMTAHHNDWDTSVQRSESSSSITSSSDLEIIALKAEMAEINKKLMKVLHINQQVKAVTHSCETCGGPHSYNDCPVIVDQTQNVYVVGAYNQGVVTTTEFTNYMKANDAILKNMQTNMTTLTNSNLELKNMFGQFMKMNTTSSSGSETLPSNTVTNPKEYLKGITTRSGIAYNGPTIPTTSSPPKVVERKTEVTKDTVPPTNNGSTKDVQPLVVQIEIQVPNSEPVVEPVEAPISASKPNLKPSIPYPSRLHDQKLRDKANDQKEKFFQIFHDLNLNISFADTLILMPKFGLTIKSFLTNKEKLFELARTPLNEHCSAVLLKKLLEKLGDPDKFLIPCDFSGMDKCLALADLGASINLMPLFTGRALIDDYEGELTLHVGNKAVTFNLDQTSRYSSNYDYMSVNRIDIIDVACEEYSQEVLGFSVSGNPAPSTKPIVSISSPTLTPFEDSDFLLEETDAFLAIDDEPISPEIDDSFYDSEGDILLLEEFLNDDPLSPPLPLQELKVVEPKNEKSSIDEPPVVELKDLPPHLEYAFLEGDDKLPVIIAKDLKDEEKIALIKVLKSHKQALAWQLFEIKDFSKIARPMTRLLEKDTSFIFSKECIEAFQSLKKKLTEAPILVAPDWDLPFELMCDASDFAIGAENLAVDHLSRLENSYQSVLDKKKINEMFPLEILNMVSFRGDSSTPWLATMDPPGDIMAQTTPPKWCLTLVSTGPQSIVMPMTWSNLVTLVNVKENLQREEMPQNSIQVCEIFEIFSGKLKTHWTGPFTITQVFPYGTVELSQTDGPNFKVNGHRLKHYFGEDIPLMVVLDLQTFPKEN
nr:reverse transcriptase domain-containing protein [Tanacetum cinerariifolium]